MSLHNFRLTTSEAGNRLRLFIQRTGNNGSLTKRPYDNSEQPLQPYLPFSSQHLCIAHTVSPVYWSRNTLPRIFRQPRHSSGKRSHSTQTLPLVESPTNPSVMTALYIPSLNMTPMLPTVFRSFSVLRHRFPGPQIRHVLFQGCSLRIQARVRNRIDSRITCIFI